MMLEGSLKVTDQELTKISLEVTLLREEGAGISDHFLLLTTVKVTSTEGGGQVEKMG